MKRKLFRWHRGQLSESLDTTIEVRSVSHMISYIIKDFPADNYLHNVRIKEECINDSSRAGGDWENQHMVIADFEGYTGQCIGWCNFIADTTPQELLEAAIILATEKHAGQVDKGGMPYILHPMRVMMSVQREYADQREKSSYWNMCIAAVLHDVIEDSNATYEELSDYGFDQDVIDILRILTKQEEEEYAKYILRVADSDSCRAMMIKLADLHDNMDEKRLSTPLSDNDRARMNLYRMAEGKLRDAFGSLIELY